MAVFSYVVLCLVLPVNARFLSLLNSVKYDSSLISFSQQFLIIFETIFYAVTYHFKKFFGYAVALSNFQNYLVMQLAGIDSA